MYLSFPVVKIQFSVTIICYLSHVHLIEFSFERMVLIKEMLSSTSHAFCCSQAIHNYGVELVAMKIALGPNEWLVMHYLAILTWL